MSWKDAPDANSELELVEEAEDEDNSEARQISLVR